MIDLDGGGTLDKVDNTCRASRDAAAAAAAAVPRCFTAAPTGRCMRQHWMRVRVWGLLSRPALCAQVLSWLFCRHCSLVPPVAPALGVYVVGRSVGIRTRCGARRPNNRFRTSHPTPNNFCHGLLAAFSPTTGFSDLSLQGGGLGDQR